jgi:hypothetical protein
MRSGTPLGEPDLALITWPAAGASKSRKEAPRDQTKPPANRSRATWSGPTPTD